jgi:hypothetical protein
MKPQICQVSRTVDRERQAAFDLASRSLIPDSWTEVDRHSSRHRTIVVAWSVVSCRLSRNRELEDHPGKPERADDVALGVSGDGRGGSQSQRLALSGGSVEAVQPDELQAPSLRVTGTDDPL